MNSQQMSPLKQSYIMMKYVMGYPFKKFFLTHSCDKKLYQAWVGTQKHELGFCTWVTNDIPGSQLAQRCTEQEPMGGGGRAREETGAKEWGRWPFHL